MTAVKSARLNGATLAGLGAILVWGSLAVVSALSGPIPPFQLTAMSFAVATLVGCGFMLATGTPMADLAKVPIASWLLGVYGLLGYHACYFLAIKSAPPVEVNILNYAWPLLIVLFASLLPRHLGGGPLGARQIAGGVIGFAGAASVPAIAGGGVGLIDLSGSGMGYAAALAAAVIWASYSVLSRLFGSVPTSAVMVSCALTSIGAGILHVLLETPVWPLAPAQWLVVAAAGIGPVGIAFYLWDIGMKRGDIALLGNAANATPLISTALLILAGFGAASAWLWLSAALVALGALVASSGRQT